jgi:hypothetical protein
VSKVTSDESSHRRRRSCSAAPPTEPPAALRPRGLSCQEWRGGLDAVSSQRVSDRYQRLDDAGDGRTGVDSAYPRSSAGLCLRDPADVAVAEGGADRGDGVRRGRLPHKAVDQDELRVRLGAGQRVVELETVLPKSLEDLAEARRREGEIGPSA